MHLLERTHQLQMLDSALAQAQAGQGCVALVHGEAGIGKTSLVEHFVSGNKNSWRILQGACDSLFTPRPLGPLHDIALQTSSPQGTQGQLIDLLDSESNRTAIFSACLNELKEQATILVIEDIHWADEATLDLLKYLGRRIRQTGSLIILTYRDDELGVDHPLRSLLGDLVSSHALHRIPVPSLSKEAVHELAKNRDIDSVELHRQTNGNPFFVTEVLAGESGIPETVRDAVLARAARLSAAARGVLEAAAVIGSRAEPWLLSDLLGAESEHIEECVGGGMLQSQGNVYSFHHELARQTILESIPPQRRLALHRQTLDALKESPVTRENLARLAHHAEVLNDPQAVLEFAPLAAWWASELGAHREAVAHYRTALQYANALSAAKRAELLDSYADECSLLDQKAEAKRAQQEALLIWQELGQREKEGRAYRRLSEIDNDFLLNPEREQNIARAIEVLETLPPSMELARAYSHAAKLHLNLNNPGSMDPIHWGTRALELAEQFKDVETQINAMSTIGAWEMAVGRRKEGQGRLERSLQLALEHGFQFHVERALANLSYELKTARDYTASLRYIEMGIDYCIQHDLDYWLAAFYTDRAQIRFHQGHWVDAERDIQTLLRMRNASELSERMRFAWLLLELQVRRGDTLSADFLNLVETSLPQVSELETQCLIAALFAEAAWLKGEIEQCRAAAEPTYRIVSSHYNQPTATNECGFSELSIWMWRAGAISEPLAGVLEPYASQIRGDWQGAAALWEKYGCPYERGMALMDGDEAAQLAALEIFERLGARPISERLKQKMRAQGMRIPRGPRPATRENPFGLTAREMEMLASLVKGQSNSAIAKQLSLSTRTVEHHIASVLQKMGVQSRAEAAALALKDGLVPYK